MTAATKAAVKGISDADEACNTQLMQLPNEGQDLRLQNAVLRADIAKSGETNEKW
jgi:hypothetical protein